MGRQTHIFLAARQYLTSGFGKSFHGSGKTLRLQTKQFHKRPHYERSITDFSGKTGRGIDVRDDPRFDQHIGMYLTEAVGRLRIKQVSPKGRGNATWRRKA